MEFNDVTRGDALRFARACPWLSYLRAFGALSRLFVQSRTAPRFTGLAFERVGSGELYRGTPIISGNEDEIELLEISWAIPFRASLRAGTETRETITGQRRAGVEV